MKTSPISGSAARNRASLVDRLGELIHGQVRVRIDLAASTTSWGDT